MADYDGLSPGQILADASVATFIADLGRGIADAQRQLDENSVNQIAEFIEPRDGLGGKSLLDLGLSPAFYHYQHADLSCSLQLTLRVQKDLSLGLNLSGSYNNNSTENNNSSQSSSSSSSGSSTRTSLRTATATVQASSVGALVIGGRNFQLSGSSAAERIRNLQTAVRDDPQAGISRILAEAQPSTLTITTDAEDHEVRIGSNSVTFLGGGFDNAIIRIGQNTNTDYVLDGNNTAATTSQADLAAYANHVRDTVAGLGYQVRLVAPGEPIYRGLYDIDEHEVDNAADRERLVQIARAQQSGGFDLSVMGYTDRPATQDYNERLGQRRADGVAEVLRENGVAASKLVQVDSNGEADARQNGDSETQYNQQFRRTDVTVPGRTAYWLFVQGDADDTITTATPDQIGQGGSDNGFIAKFNPAALSLNDHKCTVESHDFPFRSGSGTSASAEVYATNLAGDINANQAAGLQATARGNTVYIMKNGDQYSLTLLTSSSQQITMSGSNGVTVTQQFSRSQSRSATQQNTGNTTVAFGASLNVGYSRKFDMTVTGNSSISARLVAIPAPPEFLETIKNYLSGGD